MPRKNNSFTNEFKLEVVQVYLAGNESNVSIAKRFGVQNKTQVKRWVKKFKEGGFIEAFNRLPSPSSGARGVKNTYYLKSVEEERDYYKVRSNTLKSSIQICKWGNIPGYLENYQIIESMN
ncbi:transposase [Lysinibacillus sp. NPDC059133]|uniref:transposase n=1 Tax=Lysinibacillus sp. NPDC059133 TaxID=3346737 RepID=UPI0036B6B830